MSRSGTSPAKGSSAPAKLNIGCLESPAQAEFHLKVKFFGKLYASLENIQKEKAAEEGVECYKIFTNATLQAICKRIPRTKEELFQVHGIHQTKYADEVLRTIESTIKDLNYPLIPSARPQSQIESILLDSLKALRKNILKMAGVKADQFYPYASLVIISLAIPQTKEELLEVPGISKINLEKYGDQILETIESTTNKFNNNGKTKSGTNGRTESAKCVSASIAPRTGSLALGKLNSQHAKSPAPPQSEIESKLYGNSGTNDRTKSAKRVSASIAPRTSSLALGKLNSQNAKSPAPPQSEIESKLYTKLYKSLQNLRKKMAAEEGVYCFQIFHDTTLQSICRRIPRTKEELLEVCGIGEKRIEKYGERVLNKIDSSIKKFNNKEKTNGGMESAKRVRDSIPPARGSLASRKFNYRQAKSPAEPQSEIELKLLESLKKLRKSILNVAGDGVRGYHIFTDASLGIISTAIPRTKKELLKVPGISKKKLDKYGDQVLETIETTMKDVYNAEKPSSGGSECTNLAKRRKYASTSSNQDSGTAQMFTKSSDRLIALLSKARLSSEKP